MSAKEREEKCPSASSSFAYAFGAAGAAAAASDLPRFLLAAMEREVAEENRREGERGDVFRLRRAITHLLNC